MASETTSTDTSTRSMTSIYKYYYEILDLQTVGVLKAFAVDATGAATTRGQVMEEITKTAAHQPHVYAMMVKDRPELTVVHRVMHSTPPMVEKFSFGRTR